MSSFCRSLIANPKVSPGKVFRKMTKAGGQEQEEGNHGHVIQSQWSFMCAGSCPSLVKMSQRVDDA